MPFYTYSIVLGPRAGDYRPVYSRTSQNTLAISLFLHSLVCGPQTSASSSTSRSTIGRRPVAGPERAGIRPGPGRRAQLARGSGRPWAPVGSMMSACSGLIHPDSGNSRRDRAGAAQRRISNKLKVLCGCIRQSKSACATTA